MKKTIISALLAALALATTSASAMVVTATNDANLLSSAIGGQGVTISNAVLSAASSTGAGTFTAGGNLGFDSGILLTTGTVNCAPGPNNQGSCSGSGTTTSLRFDFTSTTGNIFFNYVFASEEYLEFVGTSFNDIFELKLNGTNIALLPGGGGIVSINNVNSTINSSFYRNNTPTTIDTQYDGLTTMLTAQASGLVGVNTFEFLIRDQGDSSLDSGVFIQAGTFSAEPPLPVPEPGSIALMGLGLAGLYAAKRKKAA